MNIRKVKWRDSRMYITQTTKDENWSVCEIESVGFLIKETKDYIVLAGDILEEDIRRTIVIPKENIIKHGR